MKDYTILEIVEYVLDKEPDSCLSHNIHHYGNYKEYSEEMIEETFLEQLDDFFTYEIIDLCSCGTPNNCKKDILNLLNILYNKKINPNSNEAYEIKTQQLKETFNARTVYDNSLLLFMVYILDSKGLLDHGSSIGGAWITDLGNMCRIIYNKTLEKNK